MTDERPISVAELLARSGGQPSGGGRRRRHRPDGEKSISVHELTGEIPVVRDDEDAPAAAAPVEETAAEPQQARAQEAEAQDVEAQDVEAQPAEVVEPEVVEPEAVAAEAEASETAGAEADAAEVVEPEQVEPEQAHQQYAEPQYAEQQYAEPEADPAAGTGTVEPAAEDESGPAPQAWSQWDGGVTGMATADFNTASVRERAQREDWAGRQAEPDAVEPAPAEPEGTAPDTRSLSLGQVADAARTDAAEQYPTEQYPADQAANEQAANEQAAADYAERAGFGPAPETADAATDASAETAKSGGVRSWLALIGEVVIGLIAGAGLFYGFLKLWQWGGGVATLVFTTVLAFVVIIAIVTFTHYLRKGTDYVTLGLALLVGLVVTFVPLLMVLTE